MLYSKFPYFFNGLFKWEKLCAFSILIFISGFIISCGENYIPRQRGYLRIDLPENSYKVFDSTYPYIFEYSSYSYIQVDTSKFNEPYWITITYRGFRGKIYLSYKRINGNLVRLLEDSRELAMKHIPKADAINNSIIKNPTNQVYGLLYEIDGVKAASPCQFFVTDSVTHFLRGSLYFEVIPNNDSLKPVIDFIKKDINHLIETIRWKNQK